MIRLQTAPQSFQSATADTWNDLLSRSQNAHLLVVFLRHSGCPFCVETAGDVERILPECAKHVVTPVVVTMSDPEMAQNVVSSNVAKAAVLISDPYRLVYQSAGIPRGTVWQLFGPKPCIRAISALIRGNVPRSKPQGDTNQLPGVRLLSGGIVKGAHNATHQGERLPLAKMIQSVVS